MKEAMKLALEALEAERDNYQDWDEKDGAPEYIYEAITALQEALAEQPSQQCKWPTCQSEEYQQALAEQIKRELVGDQPAQPQQEPHGWYIDEYGAVIGKSEPKSVRPGEWLPFYTSPPAQRTWVGLTDEEIYSVLENLQVMHHRPPTTDSRIVFARAIEAKLKEKNA